MTENTFILALVFALIASGCGLVDEGHCPSVENNDVFTIQFETEFEAPLQGFYGSLILEDGTELFFSCGVDSEPHNHDISCRSDDDYYTGIDYSGFALEEIVAMTAHSDDYAYHYEGDVDLDVEYTSPSCGGAFQSGYAEVVLMAAVG